MQSQSGLCPFPTFGKHHRSAGSISCTLPGPSSEMCAQLPGSHAHSSAQVLSKVQVSEMDTGVTPRRQPDMEQTPRGSFRKQVTPQRKDMAFGPSRHVCKLEESQKPGTYKKK